VYWISSIDPGQQNTGEHRERQGNIPAPLARSNFARDRRDKACECSHSDAIVRFLECEIMLPVVILLPIVIHAEHGLAALHWLTVM
jgi:hypothetical protein